MEKKYDKSADIMWIILKDGPEDYYEEIAPGFIMEFNVKKELIGIEIQNFPKYFFDKKKEVIFDKNLQT